MSLLELPIGQLAKIEHIAAREDEGLLRAMGLLEGQDVCILRQAPMGGPLQVRVGSASFAMGRALAEMIRVRIDKP